MRAELIEMSSSSKYEEFERRYTSSLKENIKGLKTKFISKRNGKIHHVEFYVYSKRTLNFYRYLLDIKENGEVSGIDIVRCNFLETCKN